MTEGLKLKGHVDAKFFRDDALVEHYSFDNLVVDNGLDYIIDRLQSNTPATASILKVGSGATAAANGNTDLQTALATVNGTNSQPSSTVSKTTAIFTGITGTITEYGLFANTTLIGRVVSGSREVLSGDKTQVEYTLTVSRS